MMMMMRTKEEAQEIASLAANNGSFLVQFNKQIRSEKLQEFAPLEKIKNKNEERNLFNGGRVQLQNKSPPSYYNIKIFPSLWFTFN